ncbi:MAG: isochorismatase family protein [Janthinobacterium lividum]
MNLSLNAKETALVLIDLQGGTAARQLAPHTAADVIARSAKLADAVRKAGGTVVYVHVLLNEIARLPADNPMQRPSEPPPASASELVPAAGFQEGTDVLITKRQWGAFHATNLDQALRRKNTKTVILAGIATNFGVESTARAAQEHGYALVFAEDAMSSMSAEMHEFSVKTLFPIMGHVRSTEEIMASLA